MEKQETSGDVDLQETSNESSISIQFAQQQQLQKQQQQHQVHQQEQQEQPPSIPLIQNIESVPMNSLRLRFAVTHCGPYVMETIFSVGAPTKEPTETLKDYLMNKKGLNNTQYRKMFNRIFREKIDRDPSCKSFCISLWFSAIQCGCDNLAPRGDDTWYSPDSLENHIKRIKDTRNNLMHSGMFISNAEFLDEFDQIRDLLNKTLELTGFRFSLESSYIDNVKVYLNDKLQEIKNCPINLLNSTSNTSLPVRRNLKGTLETKVIDALIKLLDQMLSVNPEGLYDRASCNIQLKVRLIYTMLDMVGAGREQTPQRIDQTHIFQYANGIKQHTGEKTIQVILIEGVAGIGKTTLMKFLLSDWVSGTYSVKDLHHFKFIIPVECKSQKTQSFSSLIAMMLPTARTSFGDDLHMVEFLLNLPILIIVDGLEEINDTSKQLFLNILNLENIENVTVLCTTRPEKVKDYYQMIPGDISTVHLKINGVPENSRESFLSKYHDEFKTNKVSTQETDELLNKFRILRDSLEDHWRLPFNLSLVAVLLGVDSELGNIISTPFELLHKIHSLKENKLFERLDHVNFTRDGTSHQIKSKVKTFQEELGREALLGLRDDNIVLQEETVLRLKALCISLDLPAEEIMGTFLTLKNSWLPSGMMTTTVSFSNKSIQEFYASRHIYSQVVINTDSDSEGKTISSISSIFDKLYEETSCVVNVEKYLSTFTMLLGLLHITRKDEEEDLMKEVIGDLRSTGMNDLDTWITVLRNVKFNDKTARLISQLPGIMEKTVAIKDAGVIVLPKLLKHTKPEKVNVIISSDPLKSIGLGDVLQCIEESSLKLEGIFLDHLFRNPGSSSLTEDLKQNIERVWKSCSLDTYRGEITPGLNLPKTLRGLHVSSSNKDSYGALQEFLQISTHLEDLVINITPEIDQLLLQPLPGSIYPSLIITDVHYQGIHIASQIAKRMKPSDGNMMLERIYFPRCTLESRGIRMLVRRLKGVAVRTSLVFPSSCKPQPSPETHKVEDDLGMERLNCKIEWGKPDLLPCDDVFDVDSWGEGIDPDLVPKAPPPPQHCLDV